MEQTYELSQSLKYMSTTAPFLLSSILDRVTKDTYLIVPKLLVKLI